MPGLPTAVAPTGWVAIVPPLWALLREVVVSAGLLTLSLILTAPPAGLHKGEEFTFVGTVAEAVERPTHRFRRNHELEVRVLVLDRSDTAADVAVCTRLKRSEDVVGVASSAVTGSSLDKTTPPAIRLDFVRIGTDGSVHRLIPPGAPPFRFTASTPTLAVPPVPLDTFAPFELGMFPPRPPQSAPDQPWTVAASTPNRPAETWQAKGFEFLTGERCQLLVMNQHSPDWEQPVGGQTAWHRAEAVWVSTLDGTARKVHRVIRQRDGRALAPAAWVEVKYELKDRASLNGQMYDRARQNIEAAYAALADAVGLTPRDCESRLVKLEAQLAQCDPASPYREPLVAARRVLEAVRRGDVIPVAAATTAGPARAHWPEKGQLAPDFRAGTFRLAEHRGKPVVLVFFKPASETTDLTLAIAEAIEKRYAGKVAVAAVVVFGDVAAATRDRDRLRLTIPVQDGGAVAATYGIETVPRFAVIDSAGKVHWTFTGVGDETGFLLREQVDSLVTPLIPPVGTDYRPRRPNPLPPP